MCCIVIVVLVLVGFVFLWCVVLYDFNMMLMGVLVLFVGVYLCYFLGWVLVLFVILVVFDLIFGFYDIVLYVYGVFVVIVLGGVVLC